ncbi:HK97 gp10 family phage protein [Ochrobactrum pseudogrignonense]|uniref:HK97 gp10 family phage protein n=1 Tax=Brucella pseudogrignonensis TaxID=419475 RepID=A0A7Y3WWV1_9HYPH|nr:HK97 gp10 family phage protein [Brucella pseudogrignonensis]NNV20533.1 HK97 gp10 family phage protein [Brucella pseudogrignonensis]
MSFSSELLAWVERTKRRQQVVFQTAAQFLAEDILERTPVDTGFLRGSFRTDPNKPVKIGDTPNGFEGIAAAKATDTIYMGFGAVYAMRIEYGFDGEDSLGRYYYQDGAGMVRLAWQNWPQHVSKAAAQVRSSWKGQTASEKAQKANAA